MQFEHLVGHILTPTIFDHICENYKRKVNEDPVKYPYWAGRSPVLALRKEFKNIGVVDVPKRNMVYLKFLNESRQEIAVDNYTSSHIPFFYFFPLKNQFLNFNFQSAYQYGYKSFLHIDEELEKKFEFIKQFFSFDDWETFKSNLICIEFAYGSVDE